LKHIGKYAGHVRKGDITSYRFLFQVWSLLTRPLTCFLSTSGTRKDLQFGTWTDPSFQRHYWFRPPTSGSRSG